VATDLLEVIAVRGPLHAIDGWSYLGRAFASLLSGQAHSARHLAYYAELRAALSILASSGIGVFNRRNAVIDATGNFQILSEIPTHDMAWLALSEWSTFSSSTVRLMSPIQLHSGSILDPFRAFFPGHTAAAASDLMANLGFDLLQGAVDRDQRNWSSYQPSALAPLRTRPADDAAFLRMFWQAFRPNGLELERHLLRRLLETEARIHGTEVYEYEHRFAGMDDGLKAVLPFQFLTREDDPVDHPFMLEVANQDLPASPYAMLCRAALLLRFASGMAEENLRAAGVQPAVHLSNWWQTFGSDHGLWTPGTPPDSPADLWQDIQVALDDSLSAPTGHRHEWLSALGGDAMPMCQSERAALWNLFR
jgi:hypothetical protein